MIIYCIENLITNKKYIGYSTRLNSEEKLQKSNMWGHGIYIRNSKRKYGIQHFRRWILVKDIFNFEELKRYEILWIKKLKTKHPNGYNLTNGGDGSKGIKRSDETNEKNRKNHLGKKLTTKHKQNIGLGAIGKVHNKIWKENQTKGQKKNWINRKEKYGPSGCNKLRKDIKLNTEQIIEIRNSTLKAKTLAIKFGVSRSHISNIKNFHKWNKNIKI